MRAIRFATASAAAMIAGLFAPGAWATCYVIYGADQQVIYRSQTPPVDLSRNLHETLPQVAPGDTATLIGIEGDMEITAEELAKKAGTISYDILTGIGPRVLREYINEPSETS